MKILPILRWVVVASILTLLIAFPRGTMPPPGSAFQPSAPITWFTWASFWDAMWSFIQPYTHFSLGTTYSGVSVFSEVMGHVLPSLGLLLLSLGTVIVLGIAKGMYDGLVENRSTLGTRISVLLQGMVESIPDFFVINFLVLLSFFLIRNGIKLYFVGSTEFFTGTFIPALIMAAVPVMYMARMIRINIDEQFGQQYLLTAEAKGLRRGHVILKHMLPNCFATVLTTSIPVLGMLFSNLVIVEYLFFKNGIVSGLVNAMGIIGSQPIYAPNDWYFQSIRYYAFDAHLVFAYVVVCVLIMMILWGMIRGLLGLFGYRGFTNPYSNILREQRSKRRWSWQLTVGLLMLVVIISIGCLKSMLHLPDPNHQDYVELLPDGSMVTPPYQPFTPSHWLGSDRDGRDLLSRAIYGILPTFLYAFMAVFGTLFIGTVLAVLSSIWKVPGVRFLIQVWHSLFSIVPGVIAGFLILNIPDLYWFGVSINANGASWSVKHSLLFLVVLGIVEIGRVSSQLQSVLDESQGKSYMEAVQIAGNTPWTAFCIHHSLPLRNAVLEQVAITFSRMLLLFATLGFLYQPIQQAWLSIGDHPTYTISSMDWSSLIAANAREFYAYGWMLFPPVLLITYTVVSMNLLRTGLRRMNQAALLYKVNERSRLERMEWLLQWRA